jgi:beta-1,4-mannooligosaccharide/beta-1,4-mannosyl-N-acetylglucosamine phosphorylase
MKSGLQTDPRIHRYSQNPIVSAVNVPYPAGLVFNAGVTKWQGRYVMLFRNDLTDVAARKVTGHSLGLAFSNDGVTWNVANTPLNAAPRHPLTGFYDPRLTVLEGRLYLCFATGNRGTSAGIAVTDDLERWEVLNVTVPDNRNLVLFPERIGGKIVRLERPFAGYLRAGDRFDVWLSKSPDGRYWGESELVLTCDQLPWTNDKIGPAAPPIKTPKGWLTLLHAVDRDNTRRWGWEGNWNKRYTMGVALLDLHNPAKVLGYSRSPILVPEARYSYESEGYRPYVIFATGAILEDNGEVKIYYGAADTHMALATAHVDDLLAMCEPV